MDTTKRLNKLLQKTADTAKKWRHEFVTPEHFLYVLTRDEVFQDCYALNGGDAEELRRQLKKFFKKNYEQLPEGTQAVPSLSRGFEAMLEHAALQADASGKTSLSLTHVFYGMVKLPECYAVYYMAQQNVNVNDVFFELCAREEDEEDYSGIAPDRFTIYLEEEEEGEENYEDGEWGEEHSGKKASFLNYVTCLNDVVEQENYVPLIGREKEIEETILILSRKEKNNPLHIGEPGVGKTAITYGLVRRIVEDNVPDNLKDAKVYAVDMASMVAGTQYRGDFEKRLKMVLDSLEKEPHAIVYLDEIHTVIGAGAVNGGSLDASNMLKPYLTGGKLRFIGATTYDEYKKHFEQSRSMVRRFQQVRINEPSEEECVHILLGIRSYYEDFHKVLYTEEVLRYMVALTKKYVQERFLPDKAIDLMDESGAYVKLKAGRDAREKKQALKVSKEDVEQVLAQFLHVPKQSVAGDEVEQLKTLEDRLTSQVFGQEEAIDKVCRAIKLSRSGLAEENKPVASLLFVGPTGVGKTEIARTLSKELGISLVRFDMSEYMEKHAVAKFIGAPQGYVGYEEGGLLTDAIRKTPHCVLLLDEIEKAHPDIFNVLLQVMDYATLTDNKGRKADFRNVILLMTSNAGARCLNKPAIGFNEQTRNEGAMEEEVKRLFSPEFRNRLTKVVAFHALDEVMAERIVKKQCRELEEKLVKKGVRISYEEALLQAIAKDAVASEYGARQIKRYFENEIKPAIVDELLFGQLKNGGQAILKKGENGPELLLS